MLPLDFDTLLYHPCCEMAPPFSLPLDPRVAHLPYAALVLFLIVLPLQPIWALCILAALPPLLALPCFRKAKYAIEDLWISAPGHFKPWLKWTSWSPDGPDGLIRLCRTTGTGKRLVLVTGADGGVG